MVYQVEGETIHTTLDNIYSKYLDANPMLPDYSDSWGFNLVFIYWGSLTQNQHDQILKKGYRLPPYGEMRNKTQQKHHLNNLQAITFQSYTATQ